MNAKHTVSVAAVLLTAALGLTACAPAAPAPEPTEASAPASVAAESAAPTTAPAESAPAVDLSDTTASLLFMIEEEKLAYDVYVTLGDLWGTGIYANIAESETAHQDALVPLLEARGIADPRTGTVGTFTDPELQALYDELIARGSTSAAEGIQVGILIEETDIEDLNARIAAEDEADVIAVYQRLLNGSENHLVAFQKAA